MPLRNLISDATDNPVFSSKYCVTLLYVLYLSVLQSFEPTGPVDSMCVSLTLTYDEVLRSLGHVTLIPLSARSRGLTHTGP